MNITTYARLTKEWCLTADGGLPGREKVKRSVRYYPRWSRYRRQKQRDPGLTTLDLAVPWITFEAIDYLQRILEPASVVFEYGCGGSTLFLARQVSWVTSVEHDPLWYERVARMLTTRSIANVTLKLVRPQEGIPPVGSANLPGSFGSTVMPNMSFRNYVTAVDEYPDEHFDLVSIDGRARPSCLLRAMNKVKVGRHLLLDNSERVDRYSLAIDLVGTWDKRSFFGPGPINDYFWETTIWKRSHR